MATQTYLSVLYNTGHMLARRDNCDLFILLKRQQVFIT